MFRIRWKLTLAAVFSLFLLPFFATYAPASSWNLYNTKNLPVKTTLNAAPDTLTAGNLSTLYRGDAPGDYFVGLTSLTNTIVGNDGSIFITPNSDYTITLNEPGYFTYFWVVEDTEGHVGLTTSVGILVFPDSSNSLMLIPESTRLMPGKTYSVHVYTSSAGVCGMDFSLWADSDLIRFDSINYLPMANGTDQMEKDAVIENPPGGTSVLKGAFTLLDPDLPVEKDGFVAEVWFQVPPNVWGGARMDLSAVFAGANGEDIPLAAAGVDLFIVDGIHDPDSAAGISGSLDGPGGAGVSAVLTNAEGDAFTISSTCGDTYSFTNILPGAYELSFVGDDPLYAASSGSISLVVQEGTVLDLGSSTISSLDVDGDGAFTVQDLIEIRRALRLAEGDDGYEPRADLVAPYGVITVHDWTFASTRFSMNQ